MLSIYRYFLSNRRQRVVVDGATIEWIPIVSGLPQGSVFCTLLFSFIPVKYLSWWRTGNMPMLIDDSTLVAVVRKPADMPAVAASLKRDLARVQE